MVNERSPIYQRGYADRVNGYPRNYQSWTKAQWDAYRDGYNAAKREWPVTK